MSPTILKVPKTFIFLVLLSPPGWYGWCWCRYWSAGMQRSWQACWEAPVAQWLSGLSLIIRQMVCILICALAALNWDLTCWKQCRVGEGTMDHPQERLGQISGYRDERRTDLCGVWCVAARETVAWIFYHNTNICTASHRCEPCRRDSQPRLSEDPDLPDVLDQLVVAGEGLETLLALVGLHLWPASYALASQLHCCLGHQILELNNSYYSTAVRWNLYRNYCRNCSSRLEKNCGQLVLCSFRLDLNHCKILNKRQNNVKFRQISLYLILQRWLVLKYW